MLVKTMIVGQRVYGEFINLFSLSYHLFVSAFA